jgi:hypothetical protein
MMLTRGERILPERNWKAHINYLLLRQREHQNRCVTWSQRSQYLRMVWLKEGRNQVAARNLSQVASDSTMERRLGYFRLGLHHQLQVSEADKLLEAVSQIEGQTAIILLDTG